jgi:Concanavalin A-like lectin/glucanases superfamily
MSASLIVLIPLVLLGLVTALAFVGCGFSSSGGQPVPLESLYQSAVLNTANLIAFWPLGEKSPGTKALDIAPKQAPLTAFDGTYMGSVTLNQTGIVPGDVTDTLAPCPSFNGGFVQVGFQPQLNPDGSFSIEAWVQVESVPSPAAVMVVVASNDPTDPNSLTGYQLHATAELTWAASVGLGPGPGSQFFIVKPDAGSPPTVKLGVPQYLVATFDSKTGTLTLFVDGQLSAQRSITAPMLPFSPAIMPTPFSIGALSTAGLTQSQSPFNGKIQDVAFYGAALDTQTISTHFQFGKPG